MLLSKNEKSVLKVGRFVSKWFQVSIEIRLFGKLVWCYTWPPDGVEPSEVDVKSLNSMSYEHDS